MKGKIESKLTEEKISSKTGNKFKKTVFTINGEKMARFWTPEDDNFHEGDYVEVEFEEKNGFKNIKIIKKIPSPEVNRPENINFKSPEINIDFSGVVEQLKRIADYFDSLLIEESGKD